MPSRVQSGIRIQRALQFFHHTQFRPCNAKRRNFFANAARRLLHDNGKMRANAKKLGVTGMCRGGRMVWMYTAHQKKVDRKSVV